MTEEMRRDFAGRDDLIDYLRHQFPEAAAVDDHVSETAGGRSEAEARLKQANPALYGRTRNYLDGAVTRLSPYLRHGVISLKQAKDSVLARGLSRSEVEKFISELAWRDYWQRLYVKLGDGIWRDQEPYKTGFQPEDYAEAVPEDILAGETGLACVDAFISQLYETGYLHNHARMWLAAYVVHWRRVQWQAGARWFLSHLLDGDPASNNLSWQWVASTFSHKPYIFNRENLERYTSGVFCRECPLRGRCEFEGTYEELAQRLFENLPDGNVPSQHTGGV